MGVGIFPGEVRHGMDRTGEEVGSDVWTGKLVALRRG